MGYHMHAVLGQDNSITYIARDVCMKSENITDISALRICDQSVHVVFPVTCIDNCTVLLLKEAIHWHSLYIYICLSLLQLAIWY